MKSNPGAGADLGAAWIGNLAYFVAFIARYNTSVALVLKNDLCGPKDSRMNLSMTGNQGATMSVLQREAF